MQCGTRLLLRLAAQPGYTRLAASASRPPSAAAGPPPAWDAVQTYSSSQQDTDISDADWQAVEQALAVMAATKAKPNAPGGWRDAFEYMPVHLERVGLAGRIQQLSAVHVAGTKGKGSTCAMVESILRAGGYSTGLYTSPHLVDVRERIRINGQMLPRAQFAEHFWRVHGALAQAAGRPEPRCGGAAVGMPSFFAFMTIMALDVFASLRPDVVVLEVGIGGRLDATNVLDPPAVAVAGITSLGMDHMEILGDTIDKIAREKAGIMRRGVPAISAPQPEPAMLALQEVAARVGAPLRTALPLDLYRLHRSAQDARSASSSGRSDSGGGGAAAAAASTASRSSGGAAAAVSIGGEHMRLNAAVAVALAAEWEGAYAAAAAARREQQQQQQVAAAAAMAGGVVWPQHSSAHGSGSGSAGPGSTSSSAAGAGAGTGRVAASAASAVPARDAARRSESVRRLELPAEYGAGLSAVHWPGRSQVEEDIELGAPGPGAGPSGRLTFYLDGAHTPESMATCAAWFAEELAGRKRQHGAGRHVVALLFNCMKERDPAVLLPELYDKLAGHGVTVAAAVFAPSLSGGGAMVVGPPPPRRHDGAGAPAAAAAATAAGAAAGAAAAVPPGATGSDLDLAWQTRMLDVWRSKRAGSGSGSGSGEQGPLHVTAGAGDGTSGCSDSGGSGRRSPATAAAGASPSPSPSPSSSCLPFQLPAASVLPSLPEALQALRGASLAMAQAAAASDSSAGGPVHVHLLVTGSLYLVGDVLRLMGRPPR